ncbi:hypothetical protein NE237_013594 [Protea cynaroides]|uniref:Bifunctional inhibitor/plant lipid transfer protein/seed storage helical domain-containing protein n=1 Tax=Protea cynaroides TaxID=273540 RepID=A0A9Q0GZ12_9MAGN|nr:hypothetical protein NE237_013594 [Protea cynaroides]
MMRMSRKLSLVSLMILMVVLIGTEEVVQLNALSLCNMTEDDLMACKPAVTQPNPEDPSDQCCEALSKADLTCLCSYKDSMFLPSLGIDPTLAMQLPAKCNLTPPATC